MATSNDNTVLIVDDIFDNIQLISSILEINDIDVQYATNGKQAIEMADLLLPDLILLDISMPEMDGYDVCKQLKINPKTKEIPIIFLTARIESDDVLKGFQVGAVDYVTKPYNTSELLSRVMTHLELKKSKDLIIRQNSELKELNLTKDKFFSLVAKDIRNPFEKIKDTLSSLLQSLPSYSTEQIKSQLDIMNESSKSGFNTLENLLEWSLLQTGEIEINIQKTDINTIIDSLITQLRSVANRRDILLYKSIIKDTFVMADVRTVKYVLKSLISNALTTSHAGGEVVISAIDTKYISQDYRTALNPTGYVQFSISDSSQGIKSEDLGRVFQLDYTNMTTTQQGEKTDTLNLLLSKSYIEKNNGRIWVESVYGKGSEFKFTLPKP